MAAHERATWKAADHLVPQLLGCDFILTKLANSELMVSVAFSVTLNK